MSFLDKVAKIVIRPVGALITLSDSVLPGEESQYSREDQLGKSDTLRREFEAKVRKLAKEYLDKGMIAWDVKHILSGVSRFRCLSRTRYVERFNSGQEKIDFSELTNGLQ